MPGKEVIAVRVSRAALAAARWRIADMLQQLDNCSHHEKLVRLERLEHGEMVAIRARYLTGELTQHLTELGVTLN